MVQHMLLRDHLRTCNEWIEKLWRDVHRCVLKPFSYKFRQLEEADVLDPLKKVDISIAYICGIFHHFKSIYIPRNNHRLSSEGNTTPLQLFVARFLSENHALRTHTAEIWITNPTTSFR